jgi:electron transport complex protein RnfG
MESSNTIVRDTTILVVITLVVGILLGAVNMVTKEPIAAAEQKATNEAYAVVMEGADFSDSMTDIVSEAETKYTNAELLDCRAATKDGQAAGWVVKLNATKGYGGDVCIVIGFDTDATITGFTVLSADNETPGLGANCTQESFTSQFAGKNAGDGEYKLYKASDTKPDDMSAGIDAITSATITSTAVTDAVNAANQFVHEYCMNGGSSEVSTDE